jgi:hypothetical protein
MEMVNMASKATYSLRVSEAGAAYVEEVQAKHGFSQSVVLRALFSVGTQHPDEAIVKMRQLAGEGELA